jgi:DNA transposition AAA+ family ATPase
MNLTIEQKQKVLAAMLEDMNARTMSQNAYGKYIGISGSSITQLRKGIFKTISDSTWITIARTLSVELKSNVQPWRTANTPVVQFINRQLKFCMDNSTAGMLCDLCGIGKTEAAKAFAFKHRGSVVYLDASKCKSKVRFIRTLATEFGVNAGGKVVDVLDDLVYVIKQLDTPMIIIDEAGDLEYSAFLEIKSLYNQLEGVCGFYMMGAEALEAKIERSKNNRKVGFAEIYDRFGAKYQKFMPADPTQRHEVMVETAKMIMRANGILEEEQQLDLLGKKTPSLRRLKIQIKKVRSGGIAA